jgi:iron complex outermembrane recepter protein
MEKGKLVFGGEYQPGYSFIIEGTNNNGVFSNATSNLKFPSSMGFVFAQYDREFSNQFFLTAGLSMNKLVMKMDDFTGPETRSFDPILSPRLALLKKFGNNLSAYTSYSRGYSPPTTAELYPSSGVYNSTLAPEIGNNYEVGMKGSFGFLQPSVTVYSFHLNQTIVLRRDANDADFFLNAGKTSQNGVEVFLKFIPTKIKTHQLSGWISYAYNSFHFKDYAQGTNDYSGNNLTGTPPHVASAGVDYSWRGIFLNATANYVDRIPLNDANTDFANEYFLIGLRVGYRFGKGEKPFEFFVGADNLLNQKYSLGNDLNAPSPALRYFNAAPMRNYFVGFKMRLSFIKD